LTDYIHISAIREVPQKISGYVTYNRHQPKVNKERLARRRSIRHKIDYATALEHYANMKHKTINLPYIKLKSLSSQEPICLWIKKIEKEPSQEKVYSTYGLSSSSTVPEF
jgi:CRISPR-associated endonuclease Csy4